MVEDVGGENMIGDRDTKKVRFKGLDFESKNDMVVDSILMPEISWRDKVLGQGPPNSGRDEDFELLDGDVVRTMVNGILAISFSERVQQIPIRDLRKPLVSQILVNRVVQRVEFESLPFICFSCKRFGHSKEMCSGVGTSKDVVVGKSSTMEDLLEVDKVVEPLDLFGPWMIVERKSR
ncbi:hypothetical protein Goklo_017587 [Gossypium klotzschianum]|uniref:Zinc knuckle CX2CX4HX4C domain-containing protein n=1 Tax=Gossypium klotzschianum TaxID=34286 RepID=A0A7J8UI36_9ROSI|nr:hypothetical protein [Gossypium klotzschianum]